MAIGRIALIVTIALGLLAPAAHGEAPRAKVEANFTTETPGASSGRVENGDFVDPANPDGKPHSVQRVVLQLAAGARFDTSAIPQCAASDAELMVQGPAACPADTRVGQGPVVVDSGFPGSGRFLDLYFSAFNARDGLILLGREAQSGGYLAVHGRISGGTLVIDFPPAPGTPPDGGALKTERIVFFERSGTRNGRRAAYLTTPPSCPPSGKWVNRLTYTYGDGVTQTTTSDSPCIAPAPSSRHRPRIRVRGVRRGCYHHSFRARIEVSDPTPLARVSVFVGRRRIASTRRASFRTRIRLRGLHRGRHRLTVKALDQGGDRGSRRVVFRRC